MPVSDQPITQMQGVGPKRAQALSRLGISTIGDVLSCYPRGYEDFSSPVPIRSAALNETCCIRAMVDTPVKENMIRRGMTLYKLRVSDGSGSMPLTFFNNRYVAQMLRQGQEYLFYGKVTGNLLGKQMASPEFAPEDSLGLKPVYRLTEGINNRFMRSLAERALRLGLHEQEDFLPASLRRDYELCHYRFALENIHFPESSNDLAAARRRLVFEELLTLQLGMLLMKNKNRKQTGAVCRQVDFTEFYRCLPFALTNAQKRAIRESSDDMRRPVPMNRLLQGDVGSGKTAVAAALCWYAARNGLQSALMAPTEILAQQHYRSLQPLFERCGVKAGLLTGGMPESEKKRIRGLLESGGLDMIVGTHALLQQSVVFHNLGLVITDEQHRFGVRQRAVLSEKGRNPHTLVISATPIPRTLALIVYGDLDISVLDELPAGRKKIETYFVSSSKRARVFRFIKKLVDGGAQAFIVCPLIEESESGLAAAESYAERLRVSDFSGYRIGLLHGKMKAAEKEQVMRDFAAGSYQLLVATTVIEVGIDVPNAVLMVIENAERFGFSQLHQLRGRVGRGSAQSYCIFISDARGKEATERLKFMCRSFDGFAIAQKDLEMRGPGDFFGKMQHGLPELKIADLYSDMPILKQTQQAAHTVLEKDPSLELPENQGLLQNITRLFQPGDIIFN